jgi:hypothetical protein
MSVTLTLMTFFIDLVSNSSPEPFYSTTESILTGIHNTEYICTNPETRIMIIFIPYCKTAVCTENNIITASNTLSMVVWRMAVI